MTKVWQSKKIWWDFLTRLEQIALRFPWISPFFFYFHRKRKVRKIVMTATLILVPKRKWPRAKRVKAREEERKRRVPVLSRVIFVFILFAMAIQQQILIFKVFFFQKKPCEKYLIWRRSTFLKTLIFTAK